MVGVKTPINSENDNAFWKEIILSLSEIVGVYEKANNIMSLFTLKYVREKFFQFVFENIEDGKALRILDAGTGPGTSLVYILKKSGKEHYCIGLDPLPEMINTSRKNFIDLDNVDFVRGVFEHLPFREDTFDLEVSSFAYRDAINYLSVALELSRTLKRSGQLFILDLNKPYEKRIIANFMEKIYMSIFPIFAGTILMGKNGFELYRILKKTYIRLPSSAEIYLIFKKVFKHCKYYVMLHGAVMLLHLKEPIRISSQHKG
ncbi:class I SAM-dependent methyltransferase [Fervidicoccus fontis]|uniref:class I SAM-dependent methyltransferase n=1 Tax=Fervidicoccus fontis TaxID=683846 RepID=UPI0011E52B61|nr:class I SAM-dependent methyltransferase [Fervidicoccus fontis]